MPLCHQSNLGQRLEHHVDHRGLFVLFPGVRLLGHLLCLSFGFGLNSESLGIALESNGLGLRLSLNDETIPDE